MEGIILNRGEAANLLERLFWEAPNILYRAGQNHRPNNDVKVLAPYWFMRALERDWVEGLSNPYTIDINNLKYRGVVIEPGYQQKLVLFHKDYTMYEDSSLIYELPIAVRRAEIPPKFWCDCNPIFFDHRTHFGKFHVCRMCKHRIKLTKSGIKTKKV
jgi:hypothetical protein